MSSKKGIKRKYNLNLSEQSVKKKIFTQTQSAEMKKKIDIPSPYPGRDFPLKKPPIIYPSPEPSFKLSRTWGKYYDCVQTCKGNGNCMFCGELHTNLALHTYSCWSKLNTRACILEKSLFFN